MDCDQEIFYLNPKKEIKKEIEKKIHYRQELFRTMKGKLTVTADGRRIFIYNFMEQWSDLDQIKKYDGEGAVLFQNIFFPFTEENIFLSYRGIVGIKSQKLMIGIDTGGQEKERIKTQMRAIYRASAYGEISICFRRILHVNHLKELTENMLAVKLLDQSYPEQTEGFYPSVYRLLNLICCNARQRKCDFFVYGQVEEDGSLLPDLILEEVDGLCIPSTQVLSLRKKSENCRKIFIRLMDVWHSK